MHTVSHTQTHTLTSLISHPYSHTVSVTRIWLCSHSRPSNRETWGRRRRWRKSCTATSQNIAHGKHTSSKHRPKGSSLGHPPHWQLPYTVPWLPLSQIGWLESVIPVFTLTDPPISFSCPLVGEKTKARPRWNSPEASQGGPCLARQFLSLHVTADLGEGCVEGESLDFWGPCEVEPL